MEHEPVRGLLWLDRVGTYGRDPASAWLGMAGSKDLVVVQQGWCGRQRLRCGERTPAFFGVRLARGWIPACARMTDGAV